MVRPAFRDLELKRHLTSTTMIELQYRTYRELLPIKQTDFVVPLAETGRSRPKDEVNYRDESFFR